MTEWPFSWDYPVPCKECGKEIRLFSDPCIFIAKKGAYKIGPFCGTKCADEYKRCENCMHCGWDSNWFEGCTDEIEWRVCRIDDDKEVDEYKPACEHWEADE